MSSPSSGSLHRHLETNSWIPRSNIFPVLENRYNLLISKKTKVREGVAAGAPDRSAACCYMALSHVTASTEISILGIFYYFKGTGPVMIVDLGKATSPVDVDVMPIFGLI